MKYLIGSVAFSVILFVVACSPAAAPTAAPGALTAAPSQTPPAPTFQAATNAPQPAAATPTTPVATSAPAAPAPTTAGGATLTVTSTAFSDGSKIPQKYTCSGASVSPPLQWTGAPEGTASFALIVDDPDAPSGTFTHWVDFNIPGNQTEIAEGAQNVGKAGQNSARRNGYTGPCPPSGTHHYIFKLYALDISSLNLSEGATKAQVTEAMQGHILAQGQLTGLYSK